MRKGFTASVVDADNGSSTARVVSFDIFLDTSGDAMLGKLNRERLGFRMGMCGAFRLFTGEAAALKSCSSSLDKSCNGTNVPDARRASCGFGGVGGSGMESKS